MKIRPSIFLLCAAIIALTILLIWHIKNPVPNLNETIISPKPLESTTAVAMQQKTNALAASNQTTISTPTNQLNVLRESTAEQRLKGLSTLNDIPIVFYGKVEDQFSNPVVNAIVTFGVRIYNGYESTVKSGQLISDANGLFTVSGYRGESLGLGVKKEGYALVSMNGSGIYSKLYPESQRAHPDQNNPTIIEMWKMQGAEPLVSFDKTYKLHYTDEPIIFDLVAGKIVPSGGDFIITVTRPAGIISGRNPQDWCIGVNIVNGGFIETSEGEASATYAAPQNSYLSNGVFHKNNGPNLIDKMLFVQSRNNQVYSKVHLLFGINRTPDDFMYVTFKGVANTNGSRNWEATAPQQD